MTTTTRPVRREVTWTLPEEPDDPADDLRSYLLAIHQLDSDALLLMVEYLAKRRKTLTQTIRVINAINERKTATDGRG